MRRFDIDKTTEEVVNTTNKFNVEAKPYKAIIRFVADDISKEYLTIFFDLITNDELNQAFSKEAQNKLEAWNRKGKIVITYKEQYEKLFGAFITAIEKSNQGYKWDWNPISLVGKRMVVVYREEEFLTKEKEVKITINPSQIRSLIALQNNEIKPLPLKKLKPKDGGNSNVTYQQPYQNYQPVYPTSSDEMSKYQSYQNVEDDDLPF